MCSRACACRARPPARTLQFRGASREVAAAHPKGLALQDQVDDVLDSTKRIHRKTHPGIRIAKAATVVPRLGIQGFRRVSAGVRQEEVCRGRFAG